jgi:hypothetical protein
MPVLSKLANSSLDLLAVINLARVDLSVLGLKLE